MRILIALLLTFQAASAVWIEFKGFDPTLEEILYRDIQKATDGIMEWQRDYNYGFDKGISYDGGIKVSYIKAPECFGTRQLFAQNIDRETIRIESIKINPECIDLYPKDTNKIYAMKNAVLHEVTCHGLTGSQEHTKWGLCRPALSTDKLYWGKRHRQWLKRNLDINYKDIN